MVLCSRRAPRMMAICAFAVIAIGAIGCDTDMSQLSDEERATILANGATNTTIALINGAYTNTVGAYFNRFLSNAFNNLFDIKPILR